MKVDAVLYHPTDSDKDLTVVRIKPHQVKKYAGAVLEVMAAAYARQFEQEEGEEPEYGRLPAGSAAKHFEPSDRRTQGVQAERMRTYQAERMQAYMERHGSAYWAAYDTRYATVGEGVVGIAKASPSRATLWQKATGRNPNCYVNDIAVTEPRQGVGSALLHAALTDYGDDRIVVADVMPGTEAFFEAHDFVAGSPTEYVQIGDGLLRPTRYEAPAAGAVTASLEFRNPWMHDAAVHMVS